MFLLWAARAEVGKHVIAPREIGSDESVVGNAVAKHVRDQHRDRVRHDDGQTDTLIGVSLRGAGSLPGFDHEQGRVRFSGKRLDLFPVDTQTTFNLVR